MGKLIKVNQRACGYCEFEKICSKRANYMSSENKVAGGTTLLAKDCNDYLLNHKLKSKEYPEPICQNCGCLCDKSEEVDIGNHTIELWCYCQKCKVESFHPIPEQYKDK